MIRNAHCSARSQASIPGGRYPRRDRLHLEIGQHISSRPSRTAGCKRRRRFSATCSSAYTSSLSAHGKTGRIRDDSPRHFNNRRSRGRPVAERYGSAARPLQKAVDRFGRAVGRMIVDHDQIEFKSGLLLQHRSDRIGDRPYRLRTGMTASLAPKTVSGERGFPETSAQ